MKIEAGSTFYLPYNLIDTIGIYHGGRESVTSEKKTQANRRNALKSTGPKTPEGKTAVRMNALRHGLLSKETLLPGEDGEALRGLGERLRDELQPVGELENLLVERIVASYWRLGRLGRVEAGIFAWELYGELARRAREAANSYEKYPRDPFRVTPTITDQEKYQDARSEAQEMEAKQDAETTTLGRTFIRDANGANAFSKLSRYETTIERSLYKALHELQRLQAARRGGGGALAPVAIDVDVSGVSGDELRGSCNWSRDAEIPNASELLLRTPSRRANRSWARGTRPPATIG